MIASLISLLTTNNDASQHGTSSNPGLLPILTQALFNEIEKREVEKTFEYSVKVSCAHLLFDNISDIIASATKQYSIAEVYPIANYTITQ